MNAQPAPAVPYTVIIPTVYGQMMVNRHDINQANALFKTGFAIDHAEIAMLCQLLRFFGKNPITIDVGANLGTYTLAMARHVGPGGKVYAFEPQRILCNMIAGSVALNAFSNVYVHNMAVGDCEGTIEVPQYDYDRPLNFGSVEFGSEQREPLTQQRGNDPNRVEHVPLTTLDRFNFNQVHLLKIGSMYFTQNGLVPQFDDRYRI